MKTKFEEFIELAIPNTNQREVFRLWVKNVIDGVKNDKALILYGDGATGKSTLTGSILNMLGEEYGYYDYGSLRTEYHRNEIKDCKLVIFTGYPHTSMIGALKCLIENNPMTVRKIFTKNSVVHTEWPNVIIEANSLPVDSISRRSIIIQMAQNEKLADLRLADLKAEKDSIRAWFLK